MENSSALTVVILQKGKKIQHKTSYSIEASVQGNFTLKVQGTDAGAAAPAAAGNKV